MPVITIEITEQMEAKVTDAVQKRRDFIIDGGRVWDGERNVFLKEIRFSFHESEHAAWVEKQLCAGDRP